MNEVLEIFFCFFAILYAVNGQQTICTTPVISVKIDDTQVNSSIFTSSISSDISSTEVTSQYIANDIVKDYFTHVVDGSNFVLKTTEKFGNINTDAKSTNGADLLILIAYKCSLGYSVLHVTVKNTNQNDPTFSAPSYTYSVPMPLMPKTDVTIYGDRVIATDIDFANTDIKFEINSPDFSITTTPLDNKRYQAVFSMNRVLILTESRSYTLTATDSGTPSNSATTTITIAVDSETGLDTPSFTSSIYAFNYTKNPDPTLILIGSDIAVKTNKASAAKNELIGDYKDNFKLTFDENTGGFSLEVETTNPLLLSVDNPVLLHVTFETDMSISAAISITVIKVFPTFTQNMYVGTYSFDTKNITWQNTLTVTDFETLTLEGDKATLFKLDDSSFEIKPEKPLSESDFDANGNIIMEVVAKAESGTRQATIFIVSGATNVEKSIKFNEAYYTGTYKQGESIDIISIQDSLSLADNGGAETDIELSFEGYESNFAGTCDPNTLSCAIQIVGNLNETILESNTELFITVVASSGTISGKTAMLLMLPSSVATFSFSELYYSADYTIQTSDTEMATVTLTTPLSIQNADPNDISISLNAYSSNFNIKYDNSILQWLVTVTNNLDPSVLENNTELLIQLTASNREAAGNSLTSLSIKLPDKLTVAFIQPHYSAEYVINASGVAELQLIADESIEITDYENIVITLDQYANNFKIVYGESAATVKLEVSEPLSNSLLTEYSDIRLLMTLTKGGARYGETVLTVALPELSFSRNIYPGSYSEDSGKGDVDLDMIKLVNSDVSLVQLSLSDYVEYFSLTLSGNDWTLNGLKNLSAEIKEKNNNLPILLTASRKSDQTILATSTIVINLPNEKSPSTVPVFAKFTFTGHYTISDSNAIVTLTEDISMAQTSNADSFSVSIQSTDYSSNFEVVEKADHTYTIAVKAPLSDDVLQTKSSLAFTLIAETSDGSQGFATLVITLPKLSQTSSIAFKSILHSVEYKDSKVVATIEYTTNSDDKDITFSFSGDDDYIQYFNTSHSKGTLTIRSSSLPDDVIAKNSLISFIIIALDTNTADTSQAVLNIEIDENNVDPDNHNPDDNAISKGLLVAVIVLACLLISLIVVVIVYWYFKIRNVKYVDLEEYTEQQETKETKFIKNDTKKRPDSMNSASLRRPTGIHITQIQNVPDEIEVEQKQEEPVDSPKPERTVAFNDNVENIKSLEDDEPSEKFQNVAERRPTKFVFGNPLEEGVFDSPEHSPTMDEGKKSVAFDENVERMQIEPVEVEEDDETDVSEEDKNDGNTEEENEINNEPTEDEPEVGGSEIDTTPNVMPSDIFKQIF